MIDLRAPQRVTQAAALVALTLGVGGCGSDGVDGMARPDELPVSCVARAGSGACAPGSGRWYYDYATNRCLSTSGGGCPGRRLFASPDECRRQCGAAP
jgi:hypothetical protein